jgi:hypothetical protein
VHSNNDTQLLCYCVKTGLLKWGCLRVFCGCFAALPTAKQPQISIPAQAAVTIRDRFVNSAMPDPPRLVAAAKKLTKPHSPHKHPGKKEILIG